MDIKAGRLYFIKDVYFTALADPNMKHNKSESRPYYLAHQDANGLCWMVPLSSRVDKYQNLIKRIKAGGKKTIGIDIVKLQGRPAAFLFQDMIPVLPAFISRPYLVDKGTVHLELSSKRLIKKFETRSIKIASLLRQGRYIARNAPDVEQALKIIDQAQEASKRRPLDQQLTDAKKGQGQPAKAASKSKDSQDREK